MKRFNALKMLSLLALALMSSASHAEYVKIEFTAHGTAATFNGAPEASFPSTGAGDYLKLNTAISGYFYYDLSTPATYHDLNGTGGTYSSYYSPTNIGIKFTSSTGYQFAPNDTSVDNMPSVTVDDSDSHAPSPYDSVKITGKQLTATGASQDVSLDFFDKHAGGTLTNSALPASLSLADYDGQLNFYWTDNGGSRYFIFEATVDSLKQVAAVPEPETYAMLLAGLALVGVAKRRKSRQAAA